MAAFGGQRFDIVYTGIGALVWRPDIPRWAGEFAHDYDFELFLRFDSSQRQEDGTYRLPPRQPRVPMMQSLRAPASARPEARLGRLPRAGHGTLRGDSRSALGRLLRA